MTSVRFEQLFGIPLRNGVSYPSGQRGSGVPMISMREAFTYDFIADQDCEFAPLTAREKETYLLDEGDLLFVRQSLKYEGAGALRSGCSELHAENLGKSSNSGKVG